MIVGSTSLATKPIPGFPGCDYVELLMLLNPEGLEMEEDVSFNFGCYVNAAGGIRIGRGTKLGPYCCIHSANHVCTDQGPLEEWEQRPVRIGRGVWIGCNVTIVPGSVIGDGSVIGGGSVVAGRIPKRVVAVGNPCRPVRGAGLAAA